MWSYPLVGGDREEVVFNMVNAMLLRIHQSGNLAEIDIERLELVREAITVYKNIRHDIRKAVPFFPLGLSKFSDNWIALGLECDEKSYLAVWRREGASNCVIPVGEHVPENARISCIYPAYNDFSFRYEPNNRTVSVNFEKPFTARLFLLE